jgi:hypothetical protein
MLILIPATSSQEKYQIIVANMGIQQICNSIKNYFKTIRSSYPELPGLLIVCSMGKRPGLSTIQSTANVVNALSKLGIPTGTMPDGSANLTVAFAYANINEIFRAIKKDMNMQGALLPGSLNIVVGGAGGGTGTNLNTGFGRLIFR